MWFLPVRRMNPPTGTILRQLLQKNFTQICHGRKHKQIGRQMVYLLSGFGTGLPMVEKEKLLHFSTHFGRGIELLFSLSDLPRLVTSHGSMRTSLSENTPTTRQAIALNTTRRKCSHPALVCGRQKRRLPGENQDLIHSSQENRPPAA